MRKKMPEWMSDFNVPVAEVAVVEGGEVKWTEVFHSDTRPGVGSRKTHFNVASLTKPVFAMMMLHLVKEQMLGLDESRKDGATG